MPLVATAAFNPDLPSSHANVVPALALAGAAVASALASGRALAVGQDVAGAAGSTLGSPVVKLANLGVSEAALASTGLEEMTADAVSVATLTEGLPSTTEASEIDGAARPHVRAVTGDAGAAIVGAAQEGRTAAASSASVPQSPLRAHGMDQADEILRQFRLHLAPDLRHATIELTPAELGRISIRLALTAGKLVAALRAEKRETLDVLQRHLPELRASLAQQGIHAERFELALGFHDEGRRDAFGREPRDAREPRAGTSAVSHLRPEDHVGLARAVAAATGIDTYA